MNSDREAALYEAREGFVSKEEKQLPYQLLKFAAAGLVVAGIMALWPSKKADSFDSLDALSMCQSALRQVARDPDNADIPYVPNMGSGKEFYFAWGTSTKVVRMRNGLGLDVATSGSCTVDATAKRITSLTLDGKTIL